MRNSSQLLLTFLLNACWQIALVTLLASLASWLLRKSAARYRHWIWVAALLLSVGMPMTTSLQFLRYQNAAVFESINAAQPRGIEPLVAVDVPVNEFRNSSDKQKEFLLTRTTATLFLSVYFLIVLYSTARLLQAWITTRQLKKSAILLSGDSRISEIKRRCSSAILATAQKVDVCTSRTVAVPITIGIFNPVVILPEPLLAENNDELLTSAIGHEIIHVRRRDYTFNLFYELLYLPLSFHPCAALIRRRIRQTRELSCDEVVAERILSAEAYARSLVKQASSAPPLKRLSVSTTVGIADADILEARIMSLLKKPKLDARWKRLSLALVSCLLLVPCLAAGSFAMKFDLEPSNATAVPQEPSQQEKERREKEMVNARVRVDPKQLEEMKERMASDPKFREELMAKQELELKMRAIRQAALVRAAKISMDQAIQIATSQKPGKVLECTLEGEHWKEPGVLAEDGIVFYRVLLVGTDDVETGAVTHVWVNAIDGSVMKTEKELPRKERPE